MSKDREHVIGNQSPKAIIYFIDKDWSLRKDVKDPKVITPDIGDVLDLRTSRGITGNGGNFTLVLNNKDNKYFIVDDIEKEIEQLNLLDTRKTPEIKKKDEQYGKEPYPYATAKDFLDKKEITRRLEAKDDPYGEYAPGVDASFMLQQDENEEWGYYNIPAKDMEDDEISQVNAAEYWKTISEDVMKKLNMQAKPNSDFFTEHGGDLVQGRCVFEPMQRIVILLSRRFPDKERELTTVFTGLVSSVSDSYQENLYKITIQGEDLTKWLRVTQINMNPSFITVSDLPGSGDFLMTQHKFSNMEGWQILQTLILGGKTQTQKEFGGVGRFEAVKELSPDKPAMRGKSDPENIQEVTPVGVPGMWIGPGKSGKEQLFKKDRLHLQVYHGVTAKKDGGTHIITPYKLFFRQSVNTFDNEYSTVWDVVTDVAKLTNFEFYADAYGDLWYHQPRFNNYHILNAADQGIDPQIYVIRDEDIISHDFTEADENIITSMFVTGMQDLIEGFEIPLNLANFYEDFSFVRKYGRRFLFTHHPYVRTSQDCFYFAKSLMYRINAERFTGQITILGRSEIQPAMPVYISYKNTIYYIKEVSHNFSFGGQFTTTLQLTYGHKPWEVLPEVLDYKTTPPWLASKELETKLLIEEFPVSVELRPGYRGSYVVAKDVPLSAYNVANLGYLLSVSNWRELGIYAEDKDFPGTRRTLVFVKSTINGFIEDIRSGGYVKIRGTGESEVFTITYVGIGGDIFKNLVRKVTPYIQAQQAAGSDLEKRAEAAKNNPPVSVTAGEVIGEVSNKIVDYPSNENARPDIFEVGRISSTLRPLLYYAVTRSGKPVYPNEVHATKFVDIDGEIFGEILQE